MIKFDKKKWKYKAEGNKHVVVSDGRGSCLRLLKLESNQCEKHSQCKNCHATFVNKINDVSSSDCLEKQDELLFLKYVVLPLVNYCDACQVPSVIKMPPAFLHDLAYQIQHYRPKHRQHQSLNCQASSLHMKDYCFIQRSRHLDNLISNGIVLDPHMFTVEIKLKNGFLKGYDVCTNNSIPSHPACQFCKTQVFKTLEKGSSPRCSMYCPLDLFSGDKFRMKKALYSLLLTPQNNLRLFWDGDLIFSQELANLKQSSFYESFKMIESEQDCISLLKQLFEDFQTTTDDNHLNLETFVDLVCTCLLMPVTQENDLPLISPIEKCYGFYYKKQLCKDTVCLNYEKPNDSKLDDNSVLPLPRNSILGIVLAQQKLDTHSFLDVFKKYQTLDLFLADHRNFKDELSVEPPYNSSGWQRFSNNPIKPKKSDAFEDMYQISHELRQFFVAKSFNDCSVMVSFQKVDLSESAKIYYKRNIDFNAKFNLIKDSDGNFYIASIAIVDTDPKSTDSMPVYMKKYSEISEWWSQNTQVLKASADMHGNV